MEQLRRLREVADQLLTAKGDTLLALTAEGNSALLGVRTRHRTLHVESRVNDTASAARSEWEEKRRAAVGEGVVGRWLSERIGEVGDYEVTAAARALLAEAGAEDSKRLRDEDSNPEHQNTLKRMKGAHEQRLALCRELEKLQERKTALKASVKLLQTMLNITVPQRVSDLSWRALQQQDSSFSLPLSRQLPSLSAAPLQSLSTQMHLIWSHLSSYCEARLPNASHVRLRVPKPGAQCYIELEFAPPSQRKPALTGYWLRFMDVGGRCAVEVTKGPYAANWANNVSLAYLFPRDEGQVASVPGSANARHYNWLDSITNEKEEPITAVPTVISLFSALEKRFQAQKLLVPQLDLLQKLEVQALNVGGARCTPVSRLVSFQEAPPTTFDSVLRTFNARIDLAGAAFSLAVTVKVAPDYPRTRPVMQFELIPINNNSNANNSNNTNDNNNSVKLWWPKWTGLKRIPRESQLPPLTVSDSALRSLELALNTIRPPRDANFDLSVRISKCLLAFDLYAYSVLGLESVRSTWSVARAQSVGRERRIECDELK